MENKLQQAVIEYFAPRPVRIGDVFYFVERDKTQYFREPCPVCGDKQELTVNGHTFRCPCCTGYTTDDTITTNITISSFAVRRYRVSTIAEKADEEYWERGTTRMWVRLYRKVGKGNYTWGSSGGIKEFWLSDFVQRYTQTLPDVQPSENGFDCDRGGIYDDYKLAVKVAEQMTAAECARLAEYNAKFGTSYEAHFEAGHDPKSN